MCIYQSVNKSSFVEEGDKRQSIEATHSSAMDGVVAGTIVGAEPEHLRGRTAVSRAQSRSGHPTRDTKSLRRAILHGKVSPTTVSPNHRCQCAILCTSQRDMFIETRFAQGSSGTQGQQSCLLAFLNGNVFYGDPVSEQERGTLVSTGN